MRPSPARLARGALLLASLFLALAALPQPSSASAAAAAAVLRHNASHSLQETALAALARFAAEPALAAVEIRLPPGPIRTAPAAASLTAAHSAPRGKTILWRGHASGQSRLDSLVELRGWTRVGGANDWECEAPPALRDAADPTGFRIVRQLWWQRRGGGGGGPVRLNRTQSPPEAVGLTALAQARIVPTGYVSVSNASLAWPDPAAVEICSDHTWMQHRVSGRRGLGQGEGGVGLGVGVGCVW